MQLWPKSLLYHTKVRFISAYTLRYVCAYTCCIDAFDFQPCEIAKKVKDEKVLGNYYLFVMGKLP